MKKIEVIVEPFDVEATKQGLTEIGVGPMTVTEVKAFGAHGGLTQVYRGRRYEPPFLTEAKIEIVVADDVTDDAVAVVRKRAKTDPSGESRVFVYPLEDPVRAPAAKKNIAVAL
jgi:nitrogen regulatory protein PII